MAVNAPKTKRSRPQKLLKAKLLSEKICQKTVAAELSTVQLEKDVARIFDNVKASRSRRRGFKENILWNTNQEFSSS